MGEGSGRGWGGWSQYRTYNLIRWKILKHANMHYNNIFKFIYNNIYWCLSLDKIFADKEKGIGLKCKKQSGRNLEFMEMIGKDCHFILQHVFKSINHQLQLLYICSPSLWENLWKTCSICHLFVLDLWINRGYIFQSNLLMSL